MSTQTSTQGYEKTGAYKCKTCDMIIATSAEMEHHIQNFHLGPYACKQCRAVKNTAYWLEVHVKDYHSELSTSNIAITIGVVAIIMAFVFRLMYCLGHPVCKNFFWG